MSCQSLKEAIVEMGRGRAVGAGTQAAIETHVDVCDACAALLAREAGVTSGLKALAAATSAELPSDDLRRRLRTAFEAQQRMPTPVSTTRWQWRQAAAAAATLAAVIVWWQSDDPRAPPTPALSAPANGGDAVPAAPPSRTPPPALPDKAPTPTAAPGRGGRSARTVAASRPASPPPVVNREEEFLLLPAAAGLPDFESGAIVRMELPVTLLPTYGVDLGRGLVHSRDTSVEADFLVGQDGQPRAIRLVSPGSSW